MNRTPQPEDFGYMVVAVLMALVFLCLLAGR